LTETSSWAAILVAFIVTTVFMTAFRPVAKAIGLVDKPGGRKRHAGEIPIIGGLAMFAGVFSALTLFHTENYPLSPLLVASAILVFIGATDDRFHIPPPPRLVAQIGAVLLMVYGTGLSLSNIGDPLGMGEILMGRFTLIFTVLVALSMINAYNLVDGVDGLAGSLSLVALGSVAVIAGPGHPAMFVALVFVGAIVGFLLFNFPTSWNRRVRSFMGDAGSTLLGFSIVWVTLGVSQGPERLVSPVHCLWFASIPIFDFFTCFVRRVSKGKSPFMPGRDHFHHTLMRGGFGVRGTLGVLTGLQLVYAIIGLVGHFAGVSDKAMFTMWAVLGLSQRFIIRLVSRQSRAYRLRNRRA
jgi:UDP-GlcNAc:undecaprenyl-phosphate GlcNAc-1-phosphate transferase